MALLVLTCLPVQAAKLTAGWVEWIHFGDADRRVKAKLDTGANTASINAVNIERFKRDDTRWVRFELQLEDENDATLRKTLERPVTRRIRIKEHAGKSQSRAVVKLDFCFAGQWRSAEFSLVDRSRFIYPVLLGRRFLRDNAIIDPAEVFATEARCTARKPN